MNQRQLGIITVALFATVSLSLAAATFGSATGGTTGTATSGVFNDQNVSLKDAPGPTSANVSSSPWLQVYYQYFESGNQSSNTTNASGPPGGGTDIRPLLVGVAGVLVLAIAGGLVWFRWLMSPSDAGFEDWGGAEPDTAGDSEPVVNGGNLAVEPQNDVHRAWRAMARHPAVGHADSDTPRELAAAAVDHGFDRDAVDTLTAEFEHVRYGQRRPTTERERRARTAVERLGIDPGDEL